MMLQHNTEALAQAVLELCQQAFTIGLDGGRLHVVEVQGREGNGARAVGDASVRIKWFDLMYDSRYS